VPPRDARIRIEDMLAAVQPSRSYTAGLTFETFCADQKTVDAVLRNSEVIGESARHVDDGMAAMAPAVRWIDIRDMRNVLIHEYFGAGDAARGTAGATGHSAPVEFNRMRV